MATPLFTTVILLHPTKAEADAGAKPEVVYENANEPSASERAALIAAVFHYGVALTNTGDNDTESTAEHARRLEVQVRPF